MRLRIAVCIMVWIVTLLLVGCSPKTTSNIKAVYLIGDEQQLLRSELEEHPEIAVTNSYPTLKDIISKNKAGILIDKNAINLVTDDWLHQAPQKYYPVVVVGYNDPLFVFRDALTGFGIEGPYVDWSKEKIEPGFSLWCIIDETNGHKAAFKGFNEIPNVDRILSATDEYLK